MIVCAFLINQHKLSYPGLILSRFSLVVQKIFHLEVAPYSKRGCTMALSTSDKKRRSERCSSEKRRRLADCYSSTHPENLCGK